MPTLYIFNGIHVILRIKGENDRHHTPHIHLRYGGKTETMDLDGNTIIGDIGHKQHREISNWTVANKVYLKEQWDRALVGQKVIPYEEWKEEHK